MADVPQRIWAALYGHTVAAELTPDPLSGDGQPYILATPEALAAAPEVQDLIRAAKAEARAEVLLEQREADAYAKTWVSRGTE